VPKRKTNTPRKRCQQCKRPYTTRLDGKIPKHHTSEWNLARAALDGAIASSNEEDFKANDQRLQALRDEGLEWCEGSGVSGTALNPRQQRTVSDVMRELSAATGVQLELDAHTGEPTVVGAAVSDTRYEPPLQVRYERALGDLKTAQREVERLGAVVGKLTARLIAVDAAWQARWVRAVLGEEDDGDQ
jgi:hypothetical protein